MTDNTEAMELWREARKAYRNYPFSDPDAPDNADDQAAAAIIAAKLDELRARIEGLEGELSRYQRGAGPDDWRDCPGQCGESCCGYHDACRQALKETPDAQ
jgi:hypothetical protein